MASAGLVLSLFALLTSMGLVGSQDTILDRGWLRASQAGNSGLPLNKGNLLQGSSLAQTVVKVTTAPVNSTETPLSTMSGSTIWTTWTSPLYSTSPTFEPTDLDRPSLILQNGGFLPLLPTEGESPPSASTSGDKNQTGPTHGADNTRMNKTAGTEDPSTLVSDLVSVGPEPDSGSLPAGTVPPLQDYGNGVSAVCSIFSLLMFCVSMYRAVT